MNLSLSHSSSQSFTRCPMIYYYSKIVGIRRKTHTMSGALKMGNLWDKFEDCYHTNTPFDYDAVVSDIGLYPTDLVKVTAMIEAATELKLKIDSGCETQHKITHTIDNIDIIGYADRRNGPILTESKFTTKPDFYHTLYNIEHQIGTYFLATDCTECNIQAARVPALRYNENKENIEQYYDRVLADILKRPGYYFHGLKSDGSWGYSIMRSAIDLDYLEQMYANEIKHLKFMIDNTCWYQRRSACRAPFECDYLPVCKSGVISEELYYKRD